MSRRGLADFLEELGHSGELVRVDAEVDPVLEAAEITRRTTQNDGPALLYGAAKGSACPLLTGLLGSRRRICRGLGVESLDEVSRRVETAVAPPEPGSWFEKVKTAPTRSTLAKLPPHCVRTGPVQQVVRLGGDVDLGQLPIPKSGELETGPTITAGQLIAADAESGRSTAGRYDLRVIDRDRLAAAWGSHDRPRRLLAEYARRGERMPVAVVLGGEPAVLLAAMAPLPADVDTLAVAGLLADKPVEVVTCRTNKLEVPADAEIVIEGFVDPAEPLVESGPISTPVGFYQPSRPVPAVQVTAITHRANPIFPAMMPTAPPNEFTEIARALHRVFLPLVKLAIPELVDYDLPTFGAARHWLLASIRKTYPGQARRVASAIWGLGGLMFSKLLVIVDEDVDVGDPTRAWAAVSENADPARDVFFQDGPADPWDPGSASASPGRRMSIDATRKLPDESPTERAQPAPTSDQIRQLVSDRWVEYGLGPE